MFAKGEHPDWRRGPRQSERQRRIVALTPLNFEASKETLALMEAQNASLPMGNGAQDVQQGSHAVESAQKSLVSNERLARLRERVRLKQPVSP